MSTPLEIVTDIIVNHEKQTFAEVSDNFKETVLEAVNRSIRYLYTYTDWTFRVAYLQNVNYIPGASNALPDDFLSFNQTGAVFWKLGYGEDVQYELPYKPLPEVIRLVKGRTSQQEGKPSVFSIGGPLDGASNQREIMVFPSVNCWLDLVYQATPPDFFTTSTWDGEIPRIPPAWHYVIRELAIVFRLIDKEGDSSRYQEMLKTCMKTMVEQEPHGREATNIRLPKKLWWRLGRR